MYIYIYIHAVFPDYCIECCSLFFSPLLILTQFIFFSGLTSGATGGDRPGARNSAAPRRPALHRGKTPLLLAPGLATLKMDAWGVSVRNCKNVGAWTPQQRENRWPRGRRALLQSCWENDGSNHQLGDSSLITRL